jgi:serine/threonine-protein kinase
VEKPDDILEQILKKSTSTPTIGRYEILDTLGRGNMGEVFRARDPMIGRMVALKTRRFDLLYEEKDLKYVVDRFFEEARIAGNLIHPNIVTIFDLGQDGDYCYIAMELLDGENLTVYNKEDTLLPPEKVIEIIKKICHALDFAHSRNVIHRDIKPANLMLTKDKNIKITDFGIAMNLAADQSMDIQVMGTPSYMSPEQTKGKQLTNQTDFFSVGVVFFELLCGRRPFQGRTLYELMDGIRSGKTPSIIDYNPNLPKGLDEVINKVLSKDPELRFESGKELAESIDRAMRGERISVPGDLRKASDKAKLLKAVSFFEQFTKKEIEQVCRIGRFVHYERGQVVVREGDFDTNLFILLGGKVRVIKNNKKITDLKQGACFGEMGAFTRTRRTAHVIARKTCIVLKLDLKALDQESHELKFRFYEVFIETLIGRLESTTKKLSEHVESEAIEKDDANGLEM